MTEEFALAIKQYGKRSDGYPNPRFITYVKNRPNLKAEYDSLEGDSWAEKLYLLEHPDVKPSSCPFCGKPLPFQTYIQGYSKFCSKNSCKARNAEYLKALKQGIAKVNQKERVSKIRETFIKKYGVSNPMQVPEIVQKLKEKRHAIEKERLKNRLAEFSIELLSDNYTSACNRETYKFKCTICGTEFEDHVASTRVPRCPVCRPVSIPEEDLAKWLQSLNVKLERPGKTLIYPKEIDIYLPDYKIAIEYNGAYWHGESSSGRDRNYHLEKTKACEALGIRLMHIIDIDWIERKPIIQSIISNALNINQTTYFARKLKLVEGRNSTFFKENHLRGDANASYQISLIDPDTGTIISSCSFAKARYSTLAKYELVRYATKLNCRVVGGFNRLLKHAFEKLNVDTIIAYSDRSLFTGAVYRNYPGAIELEPTAPGYYYFGREYKLLSRQSFQKHMLANKLEIYDPKLSEWENMQLNGYDRIWDCGHWRFLLKKEGVV